MSQPLEMRLEFLGDVQFARRLQRIAAKSRDMRPVFHRLADDFYAIERRQFDSQGGYASAGWRPLAASTVAARAAKGQGDHILDATGAMRRSLTTKGAPGARRRVTFDELFVGTAVKSAKGFPYPAVHQRGSGHVPRRRPVELREEDKVRWIKEVQHYLFSTSGQIMSAVDAIGRAA